MKPYSPLPEPRHNHLDCWLHDDAVIFVEREAARHKVTKATMLAIIVHEYVGMLIAMDELELTQRAQNLIATVEHPDCFDTRAETLALFQEPPAPNRAR